MNCPVVFIGQFMESFYSRTMSSDTPLKVINYYRNIEKYSKKLNAEASHHPSIHYNHKNTGKSYKTCPDLGSLQCVHLVIQEMFNKRNAFQSESCSLTHTVFCCFIHMMCYFGSFS